MRERLRPPEERRHQLTKDYIHGYRGYHTDGAVCRIRVFEREHHPPIVIASELPENTNTSITNMALALMSSS